MATPQQTHPEEHFRQTGKFKPINEYGFAITQRPSQEFIISNIQQVELDFSIQGSENAQLWRIYVEDNLSSYRNQDLASNIASGFKTLSHGGGLDDLSENFFNASGLLMERIKDHKNQYKMSMLDFNCTIVRTTHNQLKFMLEVYILTNRSIEIQKDFNEEICIRIKQQSLNYYLAQRAKALFITKDIQKMNPALQITDSNLQQAIFDLQKHLLTIKNLSVRIFTLKFQQERFSRSNQPIGIVINNKQIYEYILLRINRIKYLKYRVQENEGKQWHSFDNNLQRPSKKQNKTTPDKNKGKAPKYSILSTNGVEESKQSDSKKILMIGQPRHLKISQRVVTNPKQSNLVPSQLDYPVSVKDEKQKDNPYLDQFENLLYEEDVEENQLSLNDSFEQFEKKQNSEKNIEIINELNKRKVKETEQKKALDLLKQKVKDLISEQKQWINKNLKVKLQIKKLKNPQNQDKNKEIQEIKQKIEQLKLQESKLIEQLAEIKRNNSIEMIFFGDQVVQQSSQSQRGKEKLFSSINNLQVQPGFNQLTTSVRSNTGATKSPQPFPNQQTKTPFPTALNFKPNFRSNFPQNNNNNYSPISLYSSVPTQSFIQPGNYQYNNQPNQIRLPTNQIVNDNGTNLNQRPNLPSQNPYNNAYSSGNFIGSPMGGKKPSMQLFSPQPNKN